MQELRNDKLEGVMPGPDVLAYQSPAYRTRVLSLFLASDGAGELDVEMCLAGFKWQVRMVGSENFVVSVKRDVGKKGVGQARAWRRSQEVVLVMCCLDGKRDEGS